MILHIRSLITGENTIANLEAGSRHGTLQVKGTAGELTGYMSLDGETWQACDTYDMTGTSAVLELLVPAAGALIKIVTTGTFTDAWVNWEG